MLNTPSLQAYGPLPWPRFLQWAAQTQVAAVLADWQASADMQVPGHRHGLGLWPAKWPGGADLGDAANRALLDYLVGHGLLAVDKRDSLLALAAVAVSPAQQAGLDWVSPQAVAQCLRP